MNNEKEDVGANEYLDQYYPQNGFCLIAGENWGKRRSEISILDINSDLTGKYLNETIDLTDFNNLEELNCSYNKITEIILPNENKLELIDARWNCLVSFNYDILNHINLTVLNLENNCFKTINFLKFGKFVNLRELSIGNDKYFSEYKLINSKFNGSLEDLRKCNKLRKLFIYDRDSQINRGLEYLYDSVQIDYRGSYEISLIGEILNDMYYKVGEFYKFAQLVKNAQLINELADYEEVDDLIREAFSKIRKIPSHPWWSDPKNQLTFQMLCDENSTFRFHWFDNRYKIVKKLRAENETYYQNIEKVIKKIQRSKFNDEIIPLISFFLIYFIAIIWIVRDDIWGNNKKKQPLKNKIISFIIMIIFMLYIFWWK